MAKIDKEQLKKHQFWIGLGGFVFLFLVAVVLIQASGDDNFRKNWEKAKTAIEQAKKKNPKTEAFQKPWNDHGLKFRAHKDVVWKAAWQAQEIIYKWPDRMKRAPQYPDDKFGDTVNEDLNNRAEFRDRYKAQFVEPLSLASYVYPVDFLGGFGRVFPQQAMDGTREPSREEIWLMQEDFWVRREMLEIIRVALDKAALFHEVKSDAKEKLPAGVKARRVFRNANWELTLLIKQNAKNPRELVLGAQSTIKNINITQRTQSLVDPISNKGGLPFKIFQENGGSRVFQIAGEPLAFERESPIGQDDVTLQPVNLSTRFKLTDNAFASLRAEKVPDPVLKKLQGLKDRELDQAAFEEALAKALGKDEQTSWQGPILHHADLKPFTVEQVLAWENSPIRRIDELEISWPSHRTVTAGLKIRQDLKDLDKEEQAPVVAAPPAGPAGAIPPNPAAPGGFAPGSKGGPEVVVEDVTSVNKIQRSRYMHVTPQCRHLPVAMKLIVDQAHIQDVLAAVASSVLRVQITQVGFYHVKDVPHEKPTDDVKAPSPSTPTAPPPPLAFGPGPGRPGPGGRRGPLMPGRAFGRTPGMSFGPRPIAPGDTPAVKTMVQDGAQLVELTVYGISSLYERFPPRGKTPATSPTPAPPGAPGVRK